MECLPAPPGLVPRPPARLQETRRWSRPPAPCARPSVPAAARRPAASSAGGPGRRKPLGGSGAAPPPGPCEPVSRLPGTPHGPRGVFPRRGPRGHRRGPAPPGTSGALCPPVGGEDPCPRLAGRSSLGWLGTPTAWRVRGQAPPKAWAETSPGDGAWTSQKPHPEEIRREGEGGKQALWKLIRTTGNVPGWQEVMRFLLPRPSPFQAVVIRGPCLDGGGTSGGREGRRVTGSSWPTSGTAFFLPRAPARSRNLRACPPQAQAGSRCSPLLPVLCPGLQAWHPAWCGAWGGRGSPGSGHPSTVGKGDGSLFSSHQLFRQEKRAEVQGEALAHQDPNPRPLRESITALFCLYLQARGGWGWILRAWPVSWRKMGSPKKQTRHCVSWEKDRRCHLNFRPHSQLWVTWHEDGHSLWAAGP